MRSVCFHLPIGKQMVKREIIEQNNNQRYGLGNYRQDMSDRAKTKLDEEGEKTPPNRCDMEPRAAGRLRTVMPIEMLKGKMIVRHKIGHDRDFAGTYRGDN